MTGNLSLIHIFIGPEAEVRHCAFIRGKVIVGKGAVVGNSTELKNVILFDGVQVPHYNYVGDSILGYKAHMGAGSIKMCIRDRCRRTGFFASFCFCWRGGSGWSSMSAR